MKLSKLVGALGLSVAALVSTSVIANKAMAVESSIAEYKKVQGVSGNLSTVGSDTLANMMTFWAEDFKRHYPNINIQIQAAGSSTAPPALTEGTSQFGPMSRKMKFREIEAFEKRYGYKPTAIRVAIDALAVFAHKDNPIKGLTIKQVDGIFSVTRKCGGNEIKQWGDVGLAGSWTRKDIQLYGRNSVSGTYGYFKKKALCKGDFNTKVNEQPGSASVVQSVAASVNALGYSGIGYKTSSVKALPLSKKGGKFISATMENALNGSYPLSRYLYVYVNKHPNKALSPMQREFVKLILSKDGQSIVEKDGYIPLPAKVINSDLKKLGIQL